MRRATDPFKGNHSTKRAPEIYPIIYIDQRAVQPPSQSPCTCIAFIENTCAGFFVCCIIYARCNAAALSHYTMGTPASVRPCIHHGDWKASLERYKQRIFNAGKIIRADMGKCIYSDFETRITNARSMEKWGRGRLRCLTMLQYALRDR